MEYSFPGYLLSKQTVDDRALNKNVLSALKTNLPEQPIRIIEVGAGIGTMLRRLIRWNIVQKADYVIVDEMAENIKFASAWIPKFATEAGLSVERSGENLLRIFNNSHDIQIQLVQMDAFEFIQKNNKPADLLIAQAFLDLVPMPKSLSKLLSLSKNLTWLTINFDGMTSFEPAIDDALDKKIERLYHETMDFRPSGGDHKSGRHLFGYLKNENAEIISAGASDWVVFAKDGKFTDDEVYFLNYILIFFEESLKGHAELNEDIFADWVKKRRSQIENGELVYIAHQMDFLARV